MKIAYYLVIIVLLFASCKDDEHKRSDATFNISINVDREKDLDLASFVKKIELIPLETDTNCLLSEYNKIIYYNEIDSYLLIDKQQIVSLFKADGTFVSNSKNNQGDGPEEYRTLVDAIYNPYTGYIEILTPYGTIYCYDLNFDYVNKRMVENKDKQVFARFYPLDETSYILTPVILGAKDATIFFCDYKRKEIEAICSYEQDFICSLTMNYNPFFNIGKDLYFSPLCLDYNIYKIDVANYTLIADTKYDLGQWTVDKDEIVKQFGDISDKGTDRKTLQRNIEIMDKMNTYLLNSDYPIPIIRFMNEHYLYLYLIKNNSRQTIIYDKRNGATFFQTSKHKRTMNFCIHMEGNVLTSIVQPYEIDKYIDVNLLDEIGKRKYDSIKEEDNPIIVKYQIQ